MSPSRDCNGNHSTGASASELLQSWSASLLEWTSTSHEISDESKHHKDIVDPAQLSPGSKVIVRVHISDALQASYRTLLGGGWEQEVGVADSRSKERLAGYTQIDDDDDNDNNDKNAEVSDSRGRHEDDKEAMREKCIYVTGNILSCDWRHPKVLYSPLQSMTQNMNSNEHFRLYDKVGSSLFHMLIRFISSRLSETPLSYHFYLGLFGQCSRDFHIIIFYKIKM